MAKLAVDIEAAFNLAQERYDAVSERLEELSIPEIRERWLIPLLHLLAFEPVFQRQHLRPSEVDKLTFAITHLGWDTPESPPMILTAEELDRRDGSRKLSPHDELQRFLNLSSRHQWGIVANARELRLVRDFHHSRLKAFVGFDLDGIFESRDFEGFSSLYRLCHASRFIPRGDEKRPILDDLFDQSQREGIQVGRLLRPGVVTAIETIANGVLTADLRETLRHGGAPARGFFRELLLIVYRILFCFFAEQRGLLPSHGLYAETYSLTRLREISEQRSSDSRKHDLFEGLKATFRLLHSGASEIDVYPYNGTLFDPEATPILNASRLTNRDLIDSIRTLTSVRIQGFRQRVDFGHLGVDELGSVYESLLPYALRIAEGPRELEGRRINSGAVYLDPVSTEQAELGAYYTRPELVDFVLEISLDRLISERLDEAGKEPQAREQAILDLKVIDPACGSGAFLIAAVDRLAIALASVRAGDEAPTESAMQVCRREVLQRCIYGIDKDLFAVELCRVALWIHCAVKDMPLSMLDHRIQHGDSLVGWGPGPIPTEIPSEAFEPPSKAEREFKAFLRSAKERNRAALEAGQVDLWSVQAVPKVDLQPIDLGLQSEDSPDEVHRKERTYRSYLESPDYLKWKAAADIWTSAFFWSPDQGNPSVSPDYWRALEWEADSEVAKRAAEICDTFPALHWPLRFPEVFERGGFDCVVGNPPWEQFESREEEWWSHAGFPEIAAARGVARKALIEHLSQVDPVSLAKWGLFEAANLRLANYSRHCGRFTPGGGKANTYLLFTELTWDLLSSKGRAGILVKSALALDKGAQSVFQRLIERGVIEEFHDIVNGGPTGTNLIFTAIDAKERFALLALRAPRENLTFEATTLNWTIQEARTRKRQVLSPQVLSVLNPRTRSLGSFRSVDELEVALSIHRKLPILDFDYGGGNPWQISYHTLFNSTTDSDLFLKSEELLDKGWTLESDQVFRLGAEKALPIYEGQLVNRYDHRARTYAGYEGDRKYERAPGIPETSDSQKSDPSFEIEPRYWMMSDKAEARLRETVGTKIMIGFRNTSRPWREQRSIRGGLIPRRPATDGLPILALRVDSIFEFHAIFNSTTFDFLVRGHMPGPNLKTVWMLAQIAAPLPGIDSRIPEAAERLALTSYSVAELFDKAPYPWDPDIRYELDVGADALVAHAYALTRTQYEIVIDSFEVMGREQVRQFGHYKFKEDCLRAYKKVD